jgi:ribosome maturation factor RimP
MGQDSRRGAPRQSRAVGRGGAGRDVRGRPASDMRGRPAAGRGGPGGSRPGGDPARSAAAGRPVGASAADVARLTSLIEPVLMAMEIDLETVKLASAGRRRVLRITVDADGGLSLDEIAEISREVSARLDSKNAMGDAPYTLEVSSPGVDRPLTQPRHWRRAIGRLVVVPVGADNHQLERDPATGPGTQARVVDADLDGVTLDIGGTRRTVSYSELGPGRVQVEFGHFPDSEDVDEAEGRSDLDDFDESWDGPDEEGPDGH